MDSYDLNAPPYIAHSAFPLADFQCDEDSMDCPFSESAGSIAFSPNIDGRYQLSNASLFDTEYIDPALLEAQNPVTTDNFPNDYGSTAIQYTPNSLSPFHPEWHTPASDSEEQQQDFQSQQGASGDFPNALDTSPHGGTSFDWSGALQSEEGSLANGPNDSLAFSHAKPSGKSYFLAMRCEWPSCKKESFLTKEHFTKHLHHHRDKARDAFVIPGVCQWPGCRSRKSGVIFKTDADFDRHLKLHMKYHWCDVPGCNHGEGFARQYDLTRHLKIHSKEREFKCPESDCTSASIGFPRKDKLDAHIEARHPNLINDIKSRRCNVHGCTIKKSFDTIEDLRAHFVIAHEDSRPNHCVVESCPRHNNGFTTWGKLVEHIIAEHNPPKCTFDHCDFRSLGDVMVEHKRRAHFVGHVYSSWECKLPGCEGSKSAFPSERLRAHLAKHHAISHPPYRYIFMIAAKYGDTRHFKDLVPCKYCSGQNQNIGKTNESE